jgi:hypothetical protein
MANNHRTDVEYDMSTEYPDYEIAGYYKAVSYHRNGTAGKSQWTISVDDEFDLFAKAKRDGQIFDDKGYALWIVADAACVLGITEHESETRLARFEDGTRSDHWHGYPANYLRAKNDIPPMSLLRQWKESGLIEKSDITRLKLQKPCSLQRSL